MRLLLIRHGQSLSVVQADHEEILPDEVNFLTGQGRAETAKLGEFLSRRFPKVVMFASPLPRARETALILSQYLRCKIIFDGRLAERRCGFPPGTTCVQSRSLQDSSFTNPTYAPPGGESIAEHRARVSEFLESVLQGAIGSHQAMSIVAHGGTIEHVHGCLTGTPVEAMSKSFTSCGTASYNLWTRLIAGDGREVWRLDGVDLRPIQSP